VPLGEAPKGGWPVFFYIRTSPYHSVKPY
jgi:hypothetical protein